MTRLRLRAAGRSDGRLGRTAGLQGREAGLDFNLLAEVLELVELGVQAGCGEFLLATDFGLFTADLFFEPAHLAGGVHEVDALDGVVDLGLRRSSLGAGHKFVALAGELVELALHLVEAGLELVHHFTLGGDAGLRALGLVFRGHLALQRHLGEVVELLGVSAVAAATVLVSLARCGQGLVAPVRAFLTSSL